MNEDSETSDDGGAEVVLSIGSTFTLHDTEVAEQFIEGMCIMIIGFIEAADSKLNARLE